MLKKLITAGLLSLLFASLALAAYQPPAAPNGYILDEAEILSPETEQNLGMQLALLEQETSTQIAVATVADLQGYPIETASLEIARSWGIGQEEHNNGVLLLIAPNDREARIEVGYGLEGAITDLESSMILDEMFVHFADGDFNTGVTAGVTYLEQLARGEEFTLTVAATSDEMTIADVILGFIFLFGMFFTWMASSKSWWLGGVLGGIGGLVIFGWLGLAIGIPLGLVLDFYLSKKFYKKFEAARKAGRFRGGGPFGGFGGGSSGGGFGGFGGGGFGGGGASGRW
jgi:uncharacterized protein